MKILIITLLGLASISPAYQVSQPLNKKAIDEQTSYQCMPCGSDCDLAVYNKPGTCGHCQMKLVPAKSIRFGKVEPEKLCDFIARKGAANVVLIDVRTPQEFEGTAAEKFGRLKNAINIPIQQLAQRLAELTQYQQKEIVVYCSHSHRSPRAAWILMQNGFKKVTNMQQGMSEWKNRTAQEACSKALFVAQR